PTIGQALDFIQNFLLGWDCRHIWWPECFHRVKSLSRKEPFAASEISSRNKRNRPQICHFRPKTSLLCGKTHVFPALNDVIPGGNDIILAGDVVIRRRSFLIGGQDEERRRRDDIIPRRTLVIRRRGLVIGR